MGVLLGSIVAILFTWGAVSFYLRYRKQKQRDDRFMRKIIEQEQRMSESSDAFEA